ncbi:response regulator [Bacillus lacus]|uniref:Response regulator n=1 Tax=Metabacillus lacus TaxID=1983721 RepID=A0A7X2J059_9BACI|nr:helix-turn-helix domain-containing protein [Metabacillus lacus]MRX72819.1 response regulator [Metabacillus lacus]
MRIVIVDDEILERKAMRKFIEETMPDAEVAGEAHNGRTAISLARELQPDLMLMDIRMPGVDGLEAVREITAGNAKIKFIMVSAYDSFQYAKEAMAEGVKEYLLKPSKKEETIAAILRVKREIEEERQQLQSYHEAHSLKKQYIAERLLHGDTSPELKQLFSEAFQQFRWGYFLVTEMEAEELKPLLDQHAASQYMLVKAPHYHTAIFMIGEADKTLSSVKGDALSLARLLSRNGKKTGVGFPYTAPQKLAKSYHEAYLAYQALGENGHSYGFPVYDKRDTAELKEKVEAQIVRGSDDTALALFHQLKENMEKAQVKEWLIGIKQMLEKRGMDVHDIEILSTISSEQWEDIIRAYCDRVRWELQQKEVVQQAKHYIETHYMEQLTLEETAEHAGLSATYFTRVFKEQSGTTFIDYLTAVRMQHAKKYLEETTLSLKEITYLTGYRDQNYFSRVFKRNTGVSPKEYRKFIIKKYRKT